MKRVKIIKSVVCHRTGIVLVCGVGLLLCGVLADSPSWAIGGGALMLYSGVAM